ncbi:MAG: ATP synthase F1 subunit epsilon [Rubrimonas sp.]
MATMTIDLVSPERLLASVEAEGAQIPGVTGEFTALPGHAPYFTTLRPGLVTIRTAGGAQEFFVTGGFAEVSGEQASILAEEAVARTELTREFLDRKVAEAEQAAEAAEENKVALAQRANDFRAAIGQLGL